MNEDAIYINHPDSHLAAPCGLFCESCKHYLAKAENVLDKAGLKQGCDGCRIRNKKCAFLRKPCPALLKKEIDFCFECESFPCDNLKRLNEIYEKNYTTSLVQNLQRIQSVGLDQWTLEQRELYRCPECGGRISVHDKRCYHCQI